jgi:hypothetical protein
MKRVTLFCALCLTVIFTQAQSKKETASKFYVKIAGGYYFSVFPGQFPKVGPYEPHDAQFQYNPGTNTTTTISEKVLTGSYGAGGRGGLTFGWNITKYVAVEGSFNYYQSTKNLMTREITTMAGSSQVLGKIESKGYVKAFDFAPSVVVSPGFKGVNPYVRFGVVVPLWGRLEIETNAMQSGYTLLPNNVQAPYQTTITRKEEVHPNVTLGFQGAFGVTFPVARKLDVFVEAEYRNIPVKSKKKEVTQYNENTTVLNPADGSVIATQHRGLSDLSVAERNTMYVTTLDQNSNTPVSQTGAKVSYKDDNQPSNDLKSYINIGGLGGNVGLKWRF